MHLITEKPAEKDKPVPEPKKECWFCLHNKVSDKCANCLNETLLYEKSDGVFGSYKSAWEYGTWDDRIKPTDWTKEDQDRYLEHLASVETKRKKSS